MRYLDFEDVWAFVGRPAKQGALYIRQHETITILAWEDRVAGEDGWCWALVCGRVLKDFAFRAGNIVNRDGDISVAIEHLKQSIAQPRGAA